MLSQARSNPLPPVTRLEDNYQIRKCARLRRTLRKSLDSLFAPYYHAYEVLRAHAVELDLEKYCDIYEISRADLEDTKDLATADLSELEDVDSLQDLRLGLQKLHIVRKLLLCTLLALNADGGKTDFTRWSAANGVMANLSSVISRKVSDLDESLGKEDGQLNFGYEKVLRLIDHIDFPIPATPKIPLTPGKERMRAQMRKLSSLSHGIRGLQAKMRLLRDESDRALDESNDTLDPADNMLAQYESIGGDLKELMEEWEHGRVALTTALRRNGHARSVSWHPIAEPPSPTSSLGGATAVEGSPQDTLQALNGFVKPQRSCSNSSSGEDIFEAVALPRQRSTLTREERISKTKEDRMRRVVMAQKAQSNTHLLKELETVIKLRPRGRTTGRLGSI